MNPWRNCPVLPRYAAAALGAIHLDDPAPCTLSDGEWQEALRFADRERFTLVLRDAARDRMPESVLDRVDRDAAKNQERLRGVRTAYDELGSWLRAAGLEFVFLKGFTHTALLDAKAPGRVQYDIDLFLPREQALAAQRVLMERGYEALPDVENLPTDHLPALARKTGWQWRGDFFDPEIPLPVELHYQFWNQRLERFGAPGVEGFWGRRTASSLHRADILAYAALHVLKHVLSGSVRIYHVYEIARMLRALAGDEMFWGEWRRLHPAGLRRLEAVAFRLAREWFGGSVVGQDEELPVGVDAWFREFAVSPATVNFRPNKDHLWLHLCLLESRRDRWAIALRGLFPHTLPAAAGDSFVPKGSLSWREWLRWRAVWMSHTLGRARHHAMALPATLRSGFRWWRRSR